MPGNPEDEFDFEEDGGFAFVPDDDADAPLPGYERRDVRRTVLAPVEIEGTPEGTGSVRMGDASLDRIERTGGTVDIKRTPQTPPRDTLAETSPWWDAISSPVDPMGAGMRTHRRLSRFWEEAQRDPEALARGVADSIPFHDEIATSSLGTALSRMQPDDSPLAMEPPRTQDVERFQSGYREGDRAARERSPYAYGGGELAGTVAQAAVVPPLARGASMGSRLGSSALEGAGWAGAQAMGDSDAPTMAERASDAVIPTAMGAGMGVAGGLVGEAGRGMLRAARSGASARDEALLAATGHAGRNTGAVENFTRGVERQGVPAARARAAQTLRETGAVPGLAGVRTVRDSLEQAQTRALGVMQGVADQMQGGGPTGREVAARIRESMPREAFAGVQRDAMESLAASMESTYGANPVPYEAVVREARRLRQAGAYQSRSGQPVPMGREALAEVNDAVRGAYDDIVESTLGAETRDAYRQARRQFAVLERGLENAERGIASEAGNRSLGMTEQLALFGGGGGGTILGGAEGGALGALGTAATVAGARALRHVEPTLRASGTELLHRILQRQPQRLGRFAEPLIRAAQRGSASLAAASYVLAQQDPEFRQRLQDLEGDEDEQPEAIRAMAGDRR